MLLFKPLYRSVAFGVLLAAAVAVTACGGGSSGPAIPPAIQTSGSFMSSTTGSVVLPAVAAAGITVTGTLPQANVAAPITESVSASAPSGVTPAARTAAARLPKTSELSPLIYVELSSSSNVTLSAVPAFTFSGVTIGSGKYYLAIYTANGWEPFFGGPGSVSGTTITFPSIAGSVAITPTQPAIFALYLTTATPTPSSTATPTPTPVPTPVASPNALAFDANTPTSAPFTVTETNNSAAFTAGINCTRNPDPAPTPTPVTNNFVAQLASTTATPSNGTATFTVNSGAETGSCTVTITDANNATTTVSVTVNLTGVIIYGHPIHQVRK